MFSSERLRKRRIDMGLTQEEVGEVVGISRSGVQKHEKGIIKNVTTSTVELFARALHCAPGYLMCWTDDPRTSGGSGDQALDRLISMWESMGDDGRAKILEYADDIASKYSSTPVEDTFLIAARGGKKVIEVTQKSQKNAIADLFDAANEGERND